MRLYITIQTSFDSSGLPWTPLNLRKVPPEFTWIWKCYIGIKIDTNLEASGLGEFIGAP